MKASALVSSLLLTVMLTACGDDNEFAETGDTRSEKAVKADNLFWDFMHGKDYQRFNDVLAHTAGSHGRSNRCIGDALVKAGNTEVAAIVYNNAKQLKYYESWPFADLLERRIANITDNVDKFRQAVSPDQPADPETSLLVNTSIACAICHRGDADAHYTPPTWVGETANDYLVPF